MARFKVQAKALQPQGRWRGGKQWTPEATEAEVDQAVLDALEADPLIHVEVLEELPDLPPDEGKKKGKK